jgi:hypothetical protein
MAEETEPIKKRRGWPKGKPRGPRKAATVDKPMFTSAPEPEAPIHVKIRLKNYEGAIEFGCARRAVENGFHVFFYPSEIDRYRETRREFAVSEIVEIEITEARRIYNFSQEAVSVPLETVSIGVPAPVSSGPKIHSVRQHAAGLLGALENSQGPIRMDTVPDLNIGRKGAVTFGDSE